MSKMAEEYNKRLEKYAPDLLEALKELLRAVRQDRLILKARVSAVEAIAKVEGKL
ncbi:hypothetical protein LCGC14_1863940 [marine sediment metagenome]|uniref:Uncharacterized protein n=1 Tax=marine sediment metagenome TaxID=412755 RepID=A0A0F9J5M6_9ZZZZ